MNQAELDKELANLQKNSIGHITYVKLETVWLKGTHPFMIGRSHFPTDGGIYLKPEQHGCYYKEHGRGKACDLPYDHPVHKSMAALAIRVEPEITKEEWGQFVNAIQARKAWLDLIGLEDGSQEVIKHLLGQD